MRTERSKSIMNQTESQFQFPVTQKMGAGENVKTEFECRFMLVINKFRPHDHA